MLLLAALAPACQPGVPDVDTVRAAWREELPAFAGAEGFGKGASGWRGGDVVKVSHLGDRGPGSLRACLAGDRPRVCVIEVGGTILLDDSIAVGSNVYLAGQAAPGDGVQIRLGQSQARPLMIRAAHDVVIRHLRLRPGPSTRPSGSVDSIAIFDSHDVILDHLSLQYATDELLDVGTIKGSTYNVTVQNSILALALDRANHPKGRHSKGALICESDSVGDCGRITLLRNLFAHNRDRNPDLKGTAIGPIEVVNNLFYNPKSQFGEFYDHIGDLRVNYIGNTTQVGRSTRRRRAPHSVEIRSDFSATYDVRVHVRGNIDSKYRPELAGPEDLVVQPAGRGHLSPRPFAPLTVVAVDPFVAREAVLAQAGAIKPARDALDQRVVDDVIQRQGHVINDPADAGGWPELKGGPAPPDADDDAMPDAWEIAHGSNPEAFDPWDDVDGNGWPDLEDYLNQRAAVP